MTELDPEDQKLITLARSARARTGASEGAAVRDTDGRTYVATTVARTTLALSALQVAVAMALSSGALGLEAGAIVGEAPSAGDPGAAVLSEVAPKAVLHRADPTGAVLSS